MSQQSRASESSAEICKLLMSLQSGNPEAKSRLIERAQGRLLVLARRMLAGFPLVRQWEQTDDVLQNALLRLYTSLDHVVPDDAAGLCRLAARDIRCALIDLARHYGGPHQPLRNQQPLQRSSLMAAISVTDERAALPLLFWSDFHQAVQNLPEDLRETIDLLWYQGLQQSDVAEMLNVSERTIQRRWRQACLALHDVLKDHVTYDQ